MTVTEMLAAIMARTGWKQEDVASRLDVTQATVSRWIKGADPRGKTRDALRELYRKTVLEGDLDGMEAAAAIGRDSRDTSREVPVVGYVGAGAKVDEFGDHEEGAGLEIVQVDFPVRHGTAAVIVRGDSMLPMFEDGDLIGYIRDATDPEHLIGKVCIIKVLEGPVYIKRLKRGSEFGLYTLVSANARDIEDVEVEWAARYRFHLPADEWHRLCREF